MTRFATTPMDPGPGVPRAVRLGDLLDDFYAAAQAAHEARVHRRLRGPVTRFQRLDEELGGALVPGLHVLHAAPGAGKTAFALQVAAECGFPALFVSCEIAPLELLRRHTARVTSTFLNDLRSGALHPDDCLERARRAAAAAPDLVVADATSGWIAPQLIVDLVEATRGDSPHALIVLDSAHSWSQRLPAEVTEYDRLNLALETLAAMAHQLGCPVLVIAERNRTAMHSGGMSASAGSRRFEYQAESVLELNREKGEVFRANGEVSVTLLITKNRHGPAGKSFQLQFHGAFQRFRETDQ